MEADPFPPEEVASQQASDVEYNLFYRAHVYIQFTVPGVSNGILQAAIASPASSSSSARFVPDRSFSSGILST